MSAVIYTVVTAIVALYVVLAVCLYRRERRRLLERDRLIREAHQRADSYQGPDSLRLLQDLEAHMDAYGARVVGLYEQPHVAPDPVFAAGCDRLRGAVRDHRNDLKGGS
jgi:hypothetical protein